MSVMPALRAAQMRNHPAYWAFIVHRVSGVALACFLPVHFLVLAEMLDPASAGAFFRWSAQPLVKLAEAVLVVLFVAHLTGGLRLLALELLPWRDSRKTWIAVGFGLALAMGLLFLLAAW